MEKTLESPSPFSDRHEVVKTVCVWSDDGAIHRIEIISRTGKPASPGYAALVWSEEERDGRRYLVRDVTFPWVHHADAEETLERALETLASRLKYKSVGDSE
ncbi:MAG TPA: hypothetical protein VKU01_15100 [Bryobacteraceae bacterium]|nr:hypothetical protein [Bryobacteraceae bacterium]